jgi:hypothetical protein
MQDPFDQSVNQLVDQSVVRLCDCVTLCRIWWWVVGFCDCVILCKSDDDLNSLFNAGIKFVGHECLMQSFDQSVNQLVGQSVVRLCDCVILCRIWWWVVRFCDCVSLCRILSISQSISSSISLLFDCVIVLLYAGSFLSISQSVRRSVCCSIVWLCYSMQDPFDQSVNQLVDQSVVRLCDCVILCRIWWWVVRFCDCLLFDCVIV